jgi:hypothetical protein
MAVQRLRIANFSDGLSDDDKIGQKHAAGSATAIDFRRSPAQAGLLKRLVKESGTSITSEIYDAVRVRTSEIYLASGSKLYKRAAGTNGGNGTYTDTGVSVSQLRDLFYREDLDSLFCITQAEIGEYSKIASGSPSFVGGKYTDWTSFTQTATGGAYTIPTALAEAELISFVCSGEPLRNLVFRMVTKTGAPTITATLHDGANNVIASASVSTGSISAGADITFNFATTRLKIGNTYHIHLVSSVAGNTILTTATNTLPLAQCSITARRLIDSIISFDPYGHAAYTAGAITYICNERYLSQWEILNTSTNSMDGYEPHKLIFPSNFHTIKCAEYSEYLVVACAIKESSDTTDTRGSRGMLIFWDKTSTFYNFAIPVPQGVPQSLFSYNNALYFIASGTLYRWAGNGIETVYQFPGVDEFGDTAADAPQIDNYLQAPRNAMTVWKGLLTIIFPYTTANTLVEYGVYSFGRAKSYLPEAVGQDYLMSTGTGIVQFGTGPSPDVPITKFTYIGAFGTNLLVGWLDLVGGVSTFGIDKLNDACGFATAANWNSLWFDNGDPDVLKTPLAVKITCEALQANCTITPFIMYDRDYTQLTGTKAGQPIQAIAGDTDIVLPLDSADGFYEAAFGWNVVGSGVDDVRVRSLTFKFDDNRQNTNATEERHGT